MEVFPSFFLLVLTWAAQETFCTDPVDVDKFRQDSLTAHNNYRAKHGVGALKLNDELNALAQESLCRLAPENRNPKCDHWSQAYWGFDKVSQRCVQYTSCVTRTPQVGTKHLKHLRKHLMTEKKCKQACICQPAPENQKILKKGVDCDNEVFHYWGFDKVSQRCVEYTSCSRINNGTETEEECKEACYRVTTCHPAPKNPKILIGGSGKDCDYGVFHYWGFDKVSQRCVEWTSCTRKKNRTGTEKECMRACT